MELSYSICKCVLKYPNENEGYDKVKVFTEHIKDAHKTLTNSVICFVISVLEDDDIAIARELLATYNNENTEANTNIVCLFCGEDIEMVKDLGGDIRFTTLEIHFEKRHFHPPWGWIFK